MNKVRAFFGTAHGRIVALASYLALFTGSAVAGLLASPAAGATCTGAFCGNGGDSVDTGFSSLSTSLTGYLGDAVALVLAIVGLAVGIRMLVRWAKRAAAS